MQDWSHLQDIEGSLSESLSGKLCAIAVTGSIAAIEIHRVARQLVRHGAKVQFFLTEAASELVSPTSLGWCVGREPILRTTARCEHLEYFGKAGQADLLLVAPATANTIAKMALGIDDNIVTTSYTTAIGQGIPVLLAPGMHEPMMRNPAVLRNLEALSQAGVEILQPKLAEGKQKMMAADGIVASIRRCLSAQSLRGKRVLFTGGPTREFLDPARCLTNPSSGLTACLLAEEAHRLGAEAHLIYGPGSQNPAPWYEVERVVSAADMREAVERRLAAQSYDYCVAVAAVADFRPVQRSEKKRPSEGPFSLELEATPKILNAMRKLAPGAKIVSFKASSAQSDEEMAKEADRYLKSGRSDLVVCNSVVEPDSGFDSLKNRYLVCQQGRTNVVGPGQKRELVPELWRLFINC